MIPTIKASLAPTLKIPKLYKTLLNVTNKLSKLTNMDCQL